MAGLLAIFAGFEREILRDRTRAGLAHARQNGKRLGRPITAGLHADHVRKLRRAGVSKSEIARRLTIGRTSVRRILAKKSCRPSLLNRFPERQRTFMAFVQNESPPRSYRPPDSLRRSRRPRGATIERLPARWLCLPPA